MLLHMGKCTYKTYEALMPDTDFYIDISVPDSYVLDISRLPHSFLNRFLSCVGALFSQYVLYVLDSRPLFLMLHQLKLMSGFRKALDLASP